MKDYINTLERDFPPQNFPNQKMWQDCLKYLNKNQGNATSQAALIFAKYSYKHHILWTQCTWNDVLEPLDADTILLPLEILKCQYLRYYFPACLMALKMELDVPTSLNQQGASNFFVYSFLNTLNNHWDILNIQEKINTSALLSIAAVQRNNLSAYPDADTVLLKLCADLGSGAI